TAGGVCHFDPPYRPSLKERAFGFDEGRGGTAENPHMSVWRLLPGYTRQQPSHASNLHLDNVDHGVMPGATPRKGFLAFWKNRKLDQPRLWRGRQHGYCCPWRTRVDVLHQGEHQSIGEIWRQLKPLIQDFLFAVVIFIAQGDLSGRSVDQCLHRLFERWSL